MADNNSLMDKVRKLIALADSTKTTEAEAAAAALKVQELVQSYGLDMAQINSEEHKNEKRGMGTVDRRAMFDYQQNLMATIAKNNFCFHDIRVIYVKRKNRNSKQHFLVGRMLNIEVTLNMYDYLIGTMKRLCEQGGYIEHKTRNLFYEGATDRLVERLNQQRQFREAEELAAQSRARAAGDSKTAIALVDVYGSEADLNNDILNNYPYGTTANRRAEKQRKEREQKERYKELVEGGEDTIIAFYISHGYDRDRSVEYAKAYEAQIARGTRRASRGQQRRSNHRGFNRASDNRARRQNSEAYMAGEEAAENIGLDVQLEGGQKLIK